MYTAVGKNVNAFRSGMLGRGVFSVSNALYTLAQTGDVTSALEVVGIE